MDTEKDYTSGRRVFIHSGLSKFNLQEGTIIDKRNINDARWDVYVKLDKYEGPYGFTYNEINFL
jgi:hypothetical protein